MSLAIFDLDNTLIAGDSDHLWGEFLLDNNLVDAEDFRKSNDQFFNDYQSGSLNINAYLEFALQALTRFTQDELATLHQQFMHEKIDAIWLPKAVALIRQHRSANDTLLIITATNRFVTEPIAQKLGISELLASEPERINSKYTGKVVGVPCFQDGKITRLNQWMEKQQEKGKPVSLKGSTFYSDSFNDLPLLELVEHPVAVNPDDTLKHVAQEKAWPILNLR